MSVAQVNKEAGERELADSVLALSSAVMNNTEGDTNMEDVMPIRQDISRKQDQTIVVRDIPEVLTQNPEIQIISQQTVDLTTSNNPILDNHYLKRQIVDFPSTCIEQFCDNSFGPRNDSASISLHPTVEFSFSELEMSIGWLQKFTF